MLAEVFSLPDKAADPRIQARFVVIGGRAVIATGTGVGPAKRFLDRRALGGLPSGIASES